LLDSLRQDALDRVPDAMDEVQRTANPEDLGKLLRELCSAFELIGTAALLVDGRPDSFFLNLCRAAENWRRYLEFRGSIPSPEVMTDSMAPLVDACAAGHWPLAAAVATQASTGRKSDTDYDDEYCYARLLIEVVRGRALRTPEVDEALSASAAADQGLYASRLAAVGALLSGDGRAFAEAFAAAVGDRQASIDRQAKMVSIDPKKLAPRRHLWLEGLALLRIAESVGITVADTYLFCPPLARIPMPRPYEGDWAVTLPISPPGTARA
jgi:hypothetical protein